MWTCLPEKSVLLLVGDVLVESIAKKKAKKYADRLKMWRLIMHF